MLKFEVGQPLPLPLTAPGFEVCRSTFNSAFFDVVYWVPRDAETEKSVATWRTGTIRYGMFVANEVPFLVIDFPGANWNFDVSLNIHSVQDDKVESWLNSQGNVLNLYLCDCRSNVLLAMRMISIQPVLADKIRNTLEKQDEKYPDSAAVNAQIERVMDAFPTAHMMKKITMHKP